jgi:hypothetical protein
VKLQLAGGKTPEELQEQATGAANSNKPAQLSDTYMAWAMPHQ